MPVIGLSCSDVCVCILIVFFIRAVVSAVASLELVSPGAATYGVTPTFSLKKWRPFLVIATK